MKTLWIVRGLPGSGKSTYAKQLGVPVFEADHLFSLNGEYRFEPSRLAEAPAICQSRVFFALQSGDDLAVANTFVRAWEYAPYVAAAALAGYTVRVVEMLGQHDNVHGTPDAVIQRMREAWEPETLLPTQRVGGG